MHHGATNRRGLNSPGDDAEGWTTAREVEVLASLIRSDDDLVAMRALRALFSLLEDAAGAWGVPPSGSTASRAP